MVPDSVQAVLLVGGAGGSGLYPLTTTGLPRALLPVCNKSLISYSLEMLEHAGLANVFVVSRPPAGGGRGQPPVAFAPGWIPSAPPSWPLPPPPSRLGARLLQGRERLPAARLTESEGLLAHLDRPLTVELLSPGGGGQRAHSSHQGSLGAAPWEAAVGAGHGRPRQRLCRSAPCRGLKAQGAKSWRRSLPRSRTARLQLPAPRPPSPGTLSSWRGRSSRTAASAASWRRTVSTAPLSPPCWDAQGPPPPATPSPERPPR